LFTFVWDRSPNRRYSVNAIQSISLNRRVNGKSQSTPPPKSG
jgi:hypothetical protein